MYTEANLNANTPLALDKDVSDSVSQANANLFQAGPKHVYFHARGFALWILWSAWHGFAGAVIPYAAYSSGASNEKGQVMGFWWTSVLVFSNMVSIVTIKLALITVSWRWLTVAVLLVVQVAYFGFLMMHSSEFFALRLQWEIWGVGQEVFGSSMGWLMFVSCAARRAPRHFVPGLLPRPRRRPAGHPDVPRARGRRGRLLLRRAAAGPEGG